MQAIVSGRAGVAIIIDGDRLLSMGLDAHVSPTPCSPRDARFLLGDARDLFFVEEESIDEIRPHIVLARTQDDALQLALFTLDEKLSDPTREEAMLALDELLDLANVSSFVEGVLLSHPAPASADLTGALRLVARARVSKVEALLLKVVRSGAKVEELCRAWGSLPSSLFEDEAGRVATRVAFVRSGMFAMLVDGDIDGAMATVASIRISSNPEPAFHAWIRALQEVEPEPRRFRYETIPATMDEISRTPAFEAREEHAAERVEHRRALLIGCPMTEGTSVFRDVLMMQDELLAWDFEVAKLVGPAATRNAILEELNGLMERAATNDAIVIYYSGHGVLNYSNEEPGTSMLGLPALPTVEAAPGFRGIAGIELATLIERLAVKTTNVTVLLDCCHAPMVMPEAIDLPPEIRELRERLPPKPSSGGRSDAVLVMTMTPDTAAPQRGGEARVQMDGHLTAELCGALAEARKKPVTWGAIIDRVRALTVDRHEPSSLRAELRGPPRRLPFSLDEKPAR